MYAVCTPYSRILFFDTEKFGHFVLDAGTFPQAILITSHSSRLILRTCVKIKAQNWKKLNDTDRKLFSGSQTPQLKDRARGSSLHVLLRSFNLFYHRTLLRSNLQDQFEIFKITLEISQVIDNKLRAFIGSIRPKLEHPLVAVMRQPCRGWVNGMTERQR